MPMRRSIESPEVASACLKFLGSSLTQIPEQEFSLLGFVAERYSAYSRSM